MMLDTPVPGDPMAISPDRRRDAAAGSEHDALDFGVPVHVDVFGVSDTGHVRATNEDQPSHRGGRRMKRFHGDSRWRSRAVSAESWNGLGSSAVSSRIRTAAS